LNELKEKEKEKKKEKEKREVGQLIYGLNEYGYVCMWVELKILLQTALKSRKFEILSVR